MLHFLFACGSAPPVDAPPPEPPPAVQVVVAQSPVAPVDPAVHDAVEQAISDTYGPDGMGMADLRAGAVVEFVSLHARDGHLVYITHGVIKHRYPHEFVLRLRDPAATSPRPLIEVAPMWPVNLLREIAEAEERRGAVFRPRDLLGNITIPTVALPFRNVVFLLDPVLKGVQVGPTYVGFVQVLLFDDADWATMDAIPTGQTNTVLKARLETDPLGLVP